jgi:CubicO group peptidase (beta-lactamase class C family)
MKTRRRRPASVTRAFARTRAQLEKAIAGGDLAPGAQVCIMVGDERVADIVLGDDGTGRPMATGTVCCVYCATKPITAVAVAAHVEADRLSLDEPLGELLPNVRALADNVITLRHVLNHTAGLHEPYAVHMEMLPHLKRFAFVDAMRLPDGWEVGRDAGYSEFVAWHLLGRVLELVSGEPLRAHLRTAVLDRVGMSDTWIGMTEPEYERNAARLGMTHDLRGWAPFPLLLEQSRRVCCDTNAAYGGYTTARDLARFYRALLARLRGDGNPDLPSGATLREFCTTARARAHDVVLKRDCEYGLGFMTALADHYLNPCSPDAFGHSGWSGTSFAFADPRHDLAVAAVLNGVTQSDAAFANRSALVEAIYADLDLVEPVTAR